MLFLQESQDRRSWKNCHGKGSSGKESKESLLKIKNFLEAGITKILREKPHYFKVCPQDMRWCRIVDENGNVIAEEIEYR